MNNKNQLATKLLAMTIALLITADPVKAITDEKSRGSSTHKYDRAANQDLWNQDTKADFQFLGLILGAVKAAAGALARVVPKLGSLAARNAAKAALKAVKPLQKTSAAAKNAGDQSKKAIQVVKATKEAIEQAKGAVQGQGPAPAPALAPAAEIKEVVKELTTADKEYKESIQQVGVDNTLFLASVVKTDKIMSADAAASDFVEVTDLTEANQLLAESGNTAGVTQTQTVEKDATQKQNLASILKNPDAFSDKTAKGEHVGDCANKAITLGEKFAASLDARANAL
jgi:predicted RNA-binding protein with EMAP domain